MMTDVKHHNMKTDVRGWLEGKAKTKHMRDLKMSAGLNFAAARISALEAEVERLKNALTEIAKPTYGTELLMPDDERAELLGRHLFSKQAIARSAMEGK